MRRLLPIRQCIPTGNFELPLAANLLKGLGNIAVIPGGLAGRVSETGEPARCGHDDVSTIHSAKGQEWNSVFVLNVVDGCIPSDLGTGTTDEIEEERRLLHVAMTRAKDRLHLVVPQRFFTSGQSGLGDRHVYASRTRFIPAALLSLFDRINWPLAAPEAFGRTDARQVRLDIGARMRSMWR